MSLIFFSHWQPTGFDWPDKELHCSGSGLAETDLTAALNCSSRFIIVAFLNSNDSFSLRISVSCWLIVLLQDARAVLRKSLSGSIFLMFDTLCLVKLNENFCFNAVEAGSQLGVTFMVLSFTELNVSLGFLVFSVLRDREASCLFNSLVSSDLSLFSPLSAFS